MKNTTQPAYEEATTAMRRVPRQVRGQQRVEAILAAAEGVMAEVGFEASTTNQIAARAGVPIGSLYQFFANKNAIVEEMARRQRDMLVMGMQHTVAQAQQLTIGQAVEMLVNLAPASTMGHSRFMRLCMEATPMMSPSLSRVREREGESGGRRGPDSRLKEEVL